MFKPLVNPALIADANRILARMADTVSSAVVIAAKPRKVISAKVTSSWLLLLIKEAFS